MLQKYLKFTTSLLRKNIFVERKSDRFVLGLRRPTTIPTRSIVRILIGRGSRKVLLKHTQNKLCKVLF